MNQPGWPVLLLLLSIAHTSQDISSLGGSDGPNVAKCHSKPGSLRSRSPQHLRCCLNQAAPRQPPGTARSKFDWGNPQPPCLCHLPVCLQRAKPLTAISARPLWFVHPGSLWFLYPVWYLPAGAVAEHRPRGRHPALDLECD